MTIWSGCSIKRSIVLFSSMLTHIHVLFPVLGERFNFLFLFIPDDVLWGNLRFLSCLQLAPVLLCRPAFIPWPRCLSHTSNTRHQLPSLSFSSFLFVCPHLLPPHCIWKMKKTYLHASNTRQHSDQQGTRGCPRLCPLPHRCSSAPVPLTAHRSPWELPTSSFHTNNAFFLVTSRWRYSFSTSEVHLYYCLWAP